MVTLANYFSWGGAGEKGIIEIIICHNRYYYTKLLFWKTYRYPVLCTSVRNKICWVLKVQTTNLYYNLVESSWGLQASGKQTY